MRPYTTDFDPPAPLLEVVVSNVLNRRLRAIKAHLQTAGRSQAARYRPGGDCADTFSKWAQGSTECRVMPLRSLGS